MREDVLLRPSRRGRARPRRQEIEAGRGQLGCALRAPASRRVAPQRVQMQDVGGGVAQLLVGEVGGAPIRRLLLLGDLDAEQVAAQILEPVPVGEGAHQLARRSWCNRPARRRRPDALQHGDVEAGEMEDLEHRGIGRAARLQCGAA